MSHISNIALQKHQSFFNKAVPTMEKLFIRTFRKFYQQVDNCTDCSTLKKMQKKNMDLKFLKIWIVLP